MTRKSVRKRVRKELVATYIRSNPTEGYDGMSKRVNASYRRTGDIRLTMRETELTFDVVWEMVGFRDEVDCLDTQD
jgi:hypothetical protein